MDANQQNIADPRFQERVKESFARQGFMNLIGAELIKVEAGYCEIQLPFSETLTQQHGFFHAGAVSTIADNAAGYAAYSLMDASSSILTVEFKINLIAPAQGDFLLAKSNVLKKGKTLTICQSEVVAVSNRDEKVCAVTQATLMELKNKSDGRG